MDNGFSNESEIDEQFSAGIFIYVPQIKFRLANMQVREEIKRITAFLQDHVGNRVPVIGISGGIDSAVTLMLLKEAFPDRQIRAIFMPDSQTPQADYGDVQELQKVSGVEIRTVLIDSPVNAFKALLNVESKQALGNIKSRTRMIILYHEANVNNGIVVGTTNRSEFVVGYYTKFGDGGCDIEPIMHLLKREVRELASALNVPKDIMMKKPSAGLWESQTDESELGMTYEELDDTIVALFDQKREEKGLRFNRVMELYTGSEHKRRMPVSMLE